MEVLEAIYSRRATRKYTGEVIDEVTVKELLDAAVQAPSAINNQPWAFVVIQDPDLLKRISDRAQEILRQSPEFRLAPEPFREPIERGEFDIFYGSGTAIVVCFRTEGPHSDWDACFATQNLMLAARAKGLATCPIGFAWGALEDSELREALGIPGEYRPMLPIAVGYPAEVPPSPGRKAPEVLAWHREHQAVTA